MANKRAKKGHNSLSADQLKSVMQRLDRLEEEKAGLSADITDVYQEAKGNGFDVKAIRKLRSIMKQDEAQRTEQNEMLRMYGAALDIDPFS